MSLINLVSLHWRIFFSLSKINGITGEDQDVGMGIVGRYENKYQFPNPPMKAISA